MEKFLAKSPLHYLLVKDLSCLDPYIILQDKDKAAKKLKRILPILVKSRKFSALDCDAIIAEYHTLIHQSSSNGSLSAFSRETDMTPFTMNCYQVNGSFGTFGLLFKMY